MVRVGGTMLATMVALLMAPGATAAPPPAEYERPFIFELAGTHGYELAVLAGRRSASRGRVAVLVRGPDGEAIYGAPARFGDSGFEADLGRLGRIALRAQPSGDVRRLRSVCSEKPVPYEPVTYVGEFEFRGEGGYTEASASRLPFRPRPLVDAVCFSSGESKFGGDGVVGAGLHIGSHGGEPNLQIDARTNGHREVVEIFASLREERRGIRIERFTGGRYRHSAFSYAPDLATARLSPPAPFSGIGTFRRDSSLANRWTGDLRVDFPGRPGVPITGNRFLAVLRHGEWQTEPPHPPRRASASALTLPAWPSTKPSPTASATYSPPGPS